MRTLARLLAIVSLLMGSFHRMRFQPEPRTLWFLGALKVVAESLAPLWALLGFLGSVLGILTRARTAVVLGLAGAGLSARYTRAVVAAPGGLATAFGEGWAARISPAKAGAMLPARWTPIAPAPPPARRVADLPFATVPLPPAGPAGDRPIYCDLWFPPAGVASSGLGLIYLHGSAWYVGDKDMGTRAFFRYLAGQGHVVVDVAYRMCPETDYRGMVGDAKRAIAWLKTHAREYGLDPARIVISGGSAGGHLALLAAYTADLPDLTPPELRGQDLSVRAVVAYYGPSDFKYYEPRWLRKAAPQIYEGAIVPPGPPASRRERRAYIRLQWRRLANLPSDMFGGYPQDVPAAYRQASPRAHVGPHCPPTLLIHGSHDMLVPVESTRALAAALRDSGVPVDYLELPATEHAFDLAFLRVSPPGQRALHETERFLALVM